MRWYFAIEETGANGQTGEDAKTAVRSALALGGLEPCLLYYGAHGALTHWMQAKGVRVIDTAPGFLDTIQTAEAAGIYKAHSIGHWLRLAVPMLETEQDFVLYTDCDVVFLKRVDWAAIRPAVFAAAPEFRPDNWNYVNSGVMVMNVAAMRATYPACEAHIRARILSGSYPSYDDQFALNEIYRGHWERLDPRLNWKPYWGFDSRAGLLHFHGPKLDTLDAIATGRWSRLNPTAAQLGRMVDGHLQAYIDWLSVLGDQVQLSDIHLAVKRHKTAADLAAYALKGDIEGLEADFLDFKMFSNTF